MARPRFLALTFLLSAFAAILSLCTPAFASGNPVVSAPTLSVTNIPVGGSAEIVNVTVTPGTAPISTVHAELDKDGSYYTSTTMTNSSGNAWTCTFGPPSNYPVPDNGTSATHSWTVVVTATDTSSLTGTNTSLGAIQAADTPATVSTPTLSVTNIPVGGSPEVVTTTITPSTAGVSSVSATLYKDGAYYTNATMTNSSGNTWTCTFGPPSNYPVPVNPNPTTHSWTVVVSETDNSSVTITSSPSAAAIQTADSPATVSTPTLSVTNIPVGGSPEVVTTTITPSTAGVSSVSAILYRDGAYYTSASLTNSSGNTWTCTFGPPSNYPVPANPNPTTHSWTVIVTETDKSSVTISSNPSATATQTADSPATVSTPTLSVTNIPVGGSPEIVTTTITPSTAGVSSVTATLYRDGAYYTNASMTNSGGNTWTCTFGPPSNYPVPTNPNPTTHSWTVIVSETDNSSVTITSNPSAAAIQTADAPATVSTPTLSVTNIPVSGTPEVVTTTITPSTAGVNSVTATLYRDGNYYTNASMSHSTGNTWTCTFGPPSNYPVPANPNPTTHSWTVIVNETDNNSVTITSNPSAAAIQTADSPATVSTPTLSVIPIPAAGTPEIVTASVTPSTAGVSSVTATLYNDGAYYTSSSMTNSGGNTWTCTFGPPSNYPVPANTDTSTHAWTVVVNETDNSSVTVTSNTSAQDIQAADIAPTITSFTPTSGPVTTGVIITGTNFAGATSVNFNVTSATFTVQSNTSISTSAPMGATTGPISVTTPQGTATSTSNFTVTAAPTFVLSANPQTLTINQDGSKTTTVTLNTVGGFSNTVNLTSGSATAGIIATFNPASISPGATSTATISVSPTVAAGPASITLTGTSGSLVSSATINVTVASNPVLTSVSVTPQNSSVVIGATQQFTASGLDQFGNPLATQPSFTWTTTGGGAIGASTGLFTAQTVGGPFTVTAASDGVSGTTGVTVTAAPTFAVDTSAANLSIKQGALGTCTTSLTNLNRFTGTVALTISGLPTGVSAAFVPSSISGTTQSALTFTASPTAPVSASPVTVTITGTFGTIVKSTAIALTITAQPILTTIVVSPNTTSVPNTTTKQFGAVANDQFGNPLTTQPAFNWTVSGGGTIGSSSGLFTATTLGGPYTVSAKSGSVTGSASVSVTAAPGFTISSQPALLTVNQGSTSSTTVSLTNIGGFSGAVALTASGLPTGVTASFTPTSISGTATSVFKLSVAATAATGTYTVVVTGTSGALVRTANVSLTVAGNQILTSIAVSPQNTSVPNTTTQQFSAIANDQFGNPLLTQPVVAWSVTGGGTIAQSTGLFTASTLGGPFTVSAVSGSVTGSANVTVTAPPGITISALPASLTINQASSSSTTIRLTNVGGFSGAVALTASGVPAGVTALFSPTPISGSGTSSLTLTVGATATPGTYTIVVTGTSGALTSAMYVSLTVVARQILTSIVVSPASITVSAGTNQQYTALAYDQFGTILTTQPVVTWSVNGGGTIGSATGIFAASAAGGPFTVTALSGPITGTGQVTVTAGPSITNPLIGPATISQSGGTITISANVLDTSAALSSVTSELLMNGISDKALTMTAGSGHSYSVTAPISANVGTTAEIFTATITALDADGLSATATAVGQVTQSSPPSTLILSGPANGSTICTNTAVFTVSGSDAVTPTANLLYRYSLDGSNFTAATSSTTITLTGLSNGSHTLTVQAVDAAGNIDPVGATVTFSVSVTAPTISAITAVPADVSATITWTTDLPSTSQVFFGPTSSYGTQTILNATPVTSHSVTVLGLTASTLYHFAVSSTTSCKQTTSADQSFTTTPTQLPNLEVTQLNSVADAVEGQSLAVSWTITNVGVGSALSSWTDDVYLSTTPNYSSGAILLGQFTNPNALLTGQSYTQSQQITLPANLYGTYYLIIYTNQNQSQVESNYTDNGSSNQLNISRLQQLIVAPGALTASLTVGQSQVGNLTLTSNSTAALTGISGTVSGLPSNITAVLNLPSTLAPGGSATGTVTVTASSPAVLTANPVVTITDTQGDAVQSTLNLTVLNPGPVLTAQPGSISASMLLGQQTVYALTITNTGASTATGLTVQLPPAAQVPWLTLASPSTIGNLAPGASTTINLLLTPAETLALGVYTGNLVVSGPNSSASISYAIDATTTKTGLVDVVTSDEYTYTTAEHPPLTGATVTISDPQTGSILLSGVTDSTGNYISPTPGITAGFYDVTVSAPNHTNYNGTVQIQPGQTATVNAFVSANLVTYSWTVIPITATDTYDVTLTATFQSHVAAPIVTISPARLNLATLTFDSSGKAVVDYTLTNHGLIAAQNTTFTFPNQATDYMVPSSTNLGSIAPQSSIVVPVTVYEVNPNAPAGTTPAVALSLAQIKEGPADGGGSCAGDGAVTVSFPCGGHNDIQIIPAIVAGSSGCDGSNGTPPYDIFGGGGGGDGGGNASSIGIGAGADDQGPAEVVSNVNVCDPCFQNELITVDECILNFLPLGCANNVNIAIYECKDGILNASGGAQAAAAYGACAAGAVTTALGCAGLEVSAAANLSICAAQILTACLPDTSMALPASAKASVKAASKPASITPVAAIASTGDQILDGLLAQLSTEITIAMQEVQPVVDVFGSNKWISCPYSNVNAQQAIVQAFYNDALPTPGNPVPITPAELTALQAMPLPPQLTASDISNLVQRWNDSLTDYAAGYYTAAQLPTGSSPNFIDIGQLTADEQTANNAIQKDAANGYNGPWAGIQGAEQNIQAYLQNPQAGSSGVCATVKVQLNQTVELTRTNFQATLDLNNSSANVPISGISIKLQITNAAGQDETSLFDISDPALTVFAGGDVAGDGTLASGSTGTAQWTIIPTRQAALTATTTYYVGGVISYTQNGTAVSIPLYPTGISVVPDPYLQFHYFLNQNVYSQDPLDLPTIDPVEPFYLGVLVQNNGGGIAQNLNITSSQPQLIDNEKGLDIDFDIIGAQVNLLPVSPSLTVDLGDIQPDGGTSTATFDLTSTLAGEFIGFDATYQNEDPLGNTRTSLIDSVDTHFLSHIVQISGAETRPDFLSEESPVDESNDVGDTVWSGSTGLTAPVTYVTDAAGNSAEGTVAHPATNGTASLSSSVSNGTPSVQLTITPPQGGFLPGGYVFIRVQDPGNGQFALESVTRSDGKVIPVGADSWLTKREEHPAGATPYLSTMFYIFDNNTTGSYTLTYYPVSPVVTSITPSSATAGGPSFTVFVNGKGFVNGATVLLNGAAAATTFDSSTTLQAAVPASDIASPTSINISVSNPMNGSSASGAVILPVNPAPNVPQVSLGSPATGAIYVAPAKIMMSASASEVSGTIAKVDFYSNGIWVGNATAVPYSFTYPVANPDTYALTAVATDENGITATSPANTVQVEASTDTAVPPPTIGTIAPTSVAAGADSFVLIVNGLNYMPTSTVYWNGQPLTTSYISPTQLTAVIPASFVAQSGKISITVVNPSMNVGTSQPALLTVTAPTQTPPTVTLIAPTASADYTAPATITLSANAVAYLGATIAAVNFYSGSTLIGSATTAPFTYVYKNVPVGSYSFTAVAVDSNQTSSTPSALVPVTVSQPTPEPATDVTSLVTITKGGLSRSGKTFSQTVTMTNDSQSAITGPVSLVLDGLSPDVVLTTQAGVTTAATGIAGSPYVSNSGNLAPNGQTSWILRFSNPSLVSIAYTTRALAGTGTR